MKVGDLIMTFDGNQKYVMLTKGKISLPVKIDELDDMEFNKEVLHWSADQRTIYISIK